MFDIINELLFILTETFSKHNSKSQKCYSLKLENGNFFVSV